MALRIHRVSAAQWARLAVTRRDDATCRPALDLVVLEDAESPGRRLRAEHAEIQAYVDALAP